jgi:hypothetical protein
MTLTSWANPWKCEQIGFKAPHTNGLHLQSQDPIHKVQSDPFLAVYLLNHLLVQTTKPNLIGHSGQTSYFP